MEKTYNFRNIEEKWQQKWLEEGVFEAPNYSSKRKYYCLEMFPYPSGKIHMGHVRNYAIGDAIARFYRLQGLNVMHPIGWDAFGLPAENAAIERGVAPGAWTEENMAAMRKQLQKLGFSYDWKREIATCHVDYYRWGQWIFLKLLKKKLAYRKSALVNWCPECHTVLANEQVVDGRCWRHSDTEVVEKELEQWFFKITDYAEKLLAGHNDIQQGWPERVITMQKNWIGRSEGAIINFQGSDGTAYPIFTTRPDTVYGVTYMAIAPEHPLISKLVAEKPHGPLADFVTRIKKTSRKDRLADSGEKLGIYSGLDIINPFNQEKIPLWVANFVLMDYGTGMIMSVPAHDQRDYEFAKKYELPIIPVVAPAADMLGNNLSNLDKSNPASDKSKPTNQYRQLHQILAEKAFVESGVAINSAEYDGLTTEQFQKKILDDVEEKKMGRRKVQYRLRDWLISRQRYWGNPIPVIYCQVCGVVPVPEEDLPVILPKQLDMQVRGKSPLENDASFVHCLCPQCKQDARRETDTMDTFVDSSWYYLRYLSPSLDKAPFDYQDAEYWMAVDQYIGGVEHAVMHLLYARFLNMFLYDCGLAATSEPFKKLLTQGMVVNTSYYDPHHKKYFWKEELQGNYQTSPLDGQTALQCKLDKMSKSKNNGVDPDQMIEQYGADSIRLFTLFASPPERDLEWSEQGIEGCFRFLNRVYRLAYQVLNRDRSLNRQIILLENDDIERFVSYPETKNFYIALNRTINKVTEDIEKRISLNTAIAALMEFSNTFISYQKTLASTRSSAQTEIAGKLSLYALQQFCLLLSPFAPHFAEEIWQYFIVDHLAAVSLWPYCDHKYADFDNIEIVFQINGKVRSKALVDRNISKEEMSTMAQENERILAGLMGKDIKKIITVPGKLVNIVAK